MVEKIDKAIWAHSRWKIHLKQAIETGKSDFSVENTSNPHVCVFGQWLDSKEGKNLPEYDTIVDLHNNFHIEAANILDLALKGNASEANSKMQMGSKFNQLTARLVNKLANIGKSQQS
ncbi:CZB domain-containing protein [Candidatus Halobeggiatoa sp. HSG11]|nr:CZB domain-containing protein [Candidatus Halobeggiatoa sp. HSG11]